MEGQFEGISTRTDALYFTVVTMSTIGYGDVHPVGQTAKALVILAVAFNLVFLGAIVSAIVARMPGRGQAREAAGSDPTGDSRGDR